MTSWSQATGRRWARRCGGGDIACVNGGRGNEWRYHSSGKEGIHEPSPLRRGYLRSVDVGDVGRVRAPWIHHGEFGRFRVLARSGSAARSAVLPHRNTQERNDQYQRFENAWKTSGARRPPALGRADQFPFRACPGSGIQPEDDGGAHRPSDRGNQHHRAAEVEITGIMGNGILYYIV